MSHLPDKRARGSPRHPETEVLGHPARRTRAGSFSPIVATTRTLHGSVRPIAHDWFSLTFVRSGSAILLSEFGEQAVKIGDVIMLAANTLCGGEPEEWVVLTSLYLDQDYLADQVFWQHAASLSDYIEAKAIIDRIYAEPAQILRLGESRIGLLAPWLDEMVSLGIDGLPPTRFYRMQSLLFAVLDVVAPSVQTTLLRQTSTQRRAVRPTIPRDRQVLPLRTEARHAAELLRENPERRWKLIELARAVHLSPSQFGRVFVEAHGKTPVAYLTMVRAERMANLLRTTNEPVSVVARRAGWRDPDYAGRMFRRSIGVTPRQYRTLSMQRPRDASSGRSVR